MKRRTNPFFSQWNGPFKLNESGRSGMLRQVSLCHFPPVKKLNKATVFRGPSGRPVISWGDIRPTQASLFLISRNGRHYLTSRPASLSVAPEKWPEQFLCFSQGIFQLWSVGSVFCSRGHGRKAKLTALSLQCQDEARLGPRRQDVAWDPAGISALWVFILFQHHLKFRGLSRWEWNQCRSFVFPRFEPWRTGKL